MQPHGNINHSELPSNPQYYPNNQPENCRDRNNYPEHLSNQPVHPSNILITQKTLATAHIFLATSKQNNLAVT